MGNTAPAAASAHTSRPRVPASASSVLRSRLTAAPSSLVPAAIFPGAVHLMDPATGHVVVAVVTHGAVVHPHAVVLGPGTGDRPLQGLRMDDEVVVADRRLTLPRGDIEVTRWWSPRPVLAGLDGPGVSFASDRLRGLLSERAPALPSLEAERLRALNHALLDADERAATRAARRLLGLGEGATPTGDDLLAGLFSAIVLFSAPVDDPAVERLTRLADTVGDAVVAASEISTTALSSALLRHAVRGEVCRPAGRLLIALARRVGTPELDDAFDRLLAVGSSSGRDLAYGILAGLDVLSGHVDDDAVLDIPTTSATLAATGSS